MTRRMRTKPAQDSNKEPALLEAERSLLNELIAEDPRLKIASNQVRYAAGVDDGFGEDTVQIYRQRLRE
jgi:hypothetical protein